MLKSSFSYLDSLLLAPFDFGVLSNAVILPVVPTSSILHDEVSSAPSPSADDVFCVFGIVYGVKQWHHLLHSYLLVL